MMKTYADQMESNSGEQVTTEQSDDSQSLSLDERFEILKNERRRIVLRYLEDADETIKLRELADQVTAIENDTDVEAITSEERKRVYVGLYQFHLPKMAKMGIIEYDQDRGDITLTEVGKDLSQESGSGDSGRQWQRAYLAVAMLGVIGVVITVLAQSWLVSTGVLAVGTLLLLGLTLSHTYSYRD